MHVTFVVDSVTFMVSITFMVAITFMGDTGGMDIPYETFNTAEKTRVLFGSFFDDFNYIRGVAV